MYAIECVKKRDWNGLLEVMKTHSILITTIVVPIIVFLRYPPAVFFVLRSLWALSYVAIIGLLKTGNIELVTKLLWRNIVKLSLEQQKRAKNRKK